MHPRCGGSEPIALLTNIRVDSASAARQVAHAYHERWGVEEAHRFVKRAFDLENVRALTWVGLKRVVMLAMLAMLAYGYLATLVHERREDVEMAARSFQVIWSRSGLPVLQIARGGDADAAVWRTQERAVTRLG